MLLGILSDTHGRIEIALRAIALLQKRGCEYVIHCGDVGDGVVELLPSGSSAFVLGNNDFATAEMRQLALELDINCLGHGGVVKLEGKQIAVGHGDRYGILNGFIAARVDYLLTGHTHVPHDRLEGTTRLINPGALTRATRKTVAILDLGTDTLKFETIADR